ncbi:Fic family protein [Asticcacaulis sp. EMRT-3]|uniref:Fic family protein n=1 Tax=Asticcacaulis sp. EMRT-3 TaxID=3040349 RepID=UPI0024AF4F9F|nr:Fic family protein [Asticcacaulis sp. EMRT-3]MDI7776646.1 Fic family protein [Asticcacaulis sp. EMRT-3]
MIDRGEHVGLMEPVIPGSAARGRGELIDLALELAQQSAGFRRSLPPEIATSLSDLVRAMNCYYSNLIEGHNTHPVEIERALQQDYSTDSAKRDLQLEAAAHIAVQAWIDKGGIDKGGIDKGGLACDPLSTAAIFEIHRRFYDHLPDSLKWVENPDTGQRIAVTGGAARTLDVRVGRHVSISPGAVMRFMARLEEAFRHLGKAERIMATAAAHHRLLWIHPFLDGNGRVARLVSHAMWLEPLETGGLWSVSRGLARQVETYKRHLAQCDEGRQGDRDGRGNLSEAALVDFTRFFLQTALDQVRFMESLVQPDRLRARLRLWAQEEMALGTLPARCNLLLDALLYRGEIQRGDAAAITGLGERQARRVLSALSDAGVLASPSPRGAIRLAFPARLAGRWMPGLFPEA